MRIREVRLQNGISQKELATAIGVAPNTLSQYESGKRAPDFDTMGRISDYLHVSVDYLLGLGREKPIPEDEDGLSEKQRMVYERLAKLTPENLEIAIGQIDVLLNLQEKRDKRQTSQNQA